MRDLKESLQKMKLMVGSINLAWSIVVIFEVIVIVFIGVLSNKIGVFSWSSILCQLLLLFSFFYILIKIFFIFFNKQLSLSPIEEIEAKYQLDLINKSYARINIINETISDSLYFLNDKTCKISDEHDEEKKDIDWEKVCNKEIQEGFVNLLSPLIKNVSTILECNNNSKISIGIYLENIYRIEDGKRWESKEGLFLLRDDNQITEYCPSSLNTNEVGVKLKIQNLLRESFNNNKYFKSEFDFPNDIPNHKYSFISSIIPCVCSEDVPYGALFIITDCIGHGPNDLESILGIFNLINSNWNAKYNECVFLKFKSIQEI